MSEAVKVGGIDTPFEWVIVGVRQPASFFEHLPVLLPADAVLYMEGLKIVPEVAAFYYAHRVPNPAKIRCETIYPKPQTYQVSFSADVCAALREFAGSRPIADMFDHIKAYQGETLLLYFHDAFENCLRLSDQLPEDKVAKFCEALGVARNREKTQRIDLEQLRRIQLAFERLERSQAPWFKRAWYWITGG